MIASPHGGSGIAGRPPGDGACSPPLLQGKTPFGRGLQARP
ncbi:hypothetical protein B4135_3242 [Caldibacillus debilis]|uniref:Uncharacterized protein n=1 Tax=Caldibacillus debilis TaxID=301148 RepID=A0A150LFM0_9BACI|nr:hypothetical protein B4135_3242 [Caldibacillus debilis]